MGLTPRLVSKGHPWKWWIIGPLAKTRGFLLKPWVWGSCTTKLKPQLQLVVLVVRWLVGRLANSMVVDSSTRPRIAPASQKPLSLFGNGWEMEWNGTSFWLRALILLSCMQVPDVCCHDRRLCSNKKATCCARIGVKTLHSSWKHGPEDSQTIPQMHVQRIIFWYSFSCPNIQWNAAPHTFRATKLLRSSFSRRLYLSKRRFKSDMPASVWYLFKSSKRPDSSKCGKKNKFKSRNMPKSLVCKENSENKTQNLETCYVYKDNLRQLQDLLDLSSGPPFTEKATFRTEFRRS